MTEDNHNSLQARALLAITGLSALLTAAAVFLLWPFSRHGVQKYRDLIVGEITLADGYKSGDYLLSYLAVVLFFAFWLLLWLAGRRLMTSTSTAPPRGDRLPGEPLVWGLGAFLAGLLLVHRPFGLLEAVVLGMLLLLGCALAAGRGREGWGESVARNGAWLGGTSLFGVASLLGLASLITFLYPATALLGDALPRVAAGAAAALFLAGCFCLRLSTAVRRRIALVSQWGAPLLFLVGFTRIFRQGDLVTGNEIPLLTKLVALCLALAGVAVSVGLSRRNGQREDGEDLPVLLPTVVSLGAFLAFKTPEYFPHDYFHVGESWITWQQIAELGKFPYSGYAIQRGFVDMLPGLLNVLFFDGSYASYNSAFALWWLLGGALAAWLVCRSVGTSWGLVLTLCLAPLGVFKLWLFLPIMLILAHPPLLARPGRWLVVWFLSCLTYCLYQHTNGIALTLGTMPVAGWVVLGALHRGELQTLWRESRGRVLATVGGCLLILLALAPVLFAWVTFIREQGGANEIANGVILGQRVVVAEWFRWQNGIAWEAFRCGGWLAGMALLWHLFVRERLHLAGPERRWRVTPEAVICLTGIVAAAAFIPYSMGRIDPKGLSRPGSIMQLLVGCMAPLVLIYGRSWLRPAVAAAGVGLLLGLTVASDYSDLSLLPGRALAAMEVPLEARLTDGAQLGLPRLGKGFMTPEQFQDIVSVKQVMDLVLRPGESYLDLTNNMAFYPLLGKEVQSVYAGYYIATSQQIQERMLRALAQHPPPLVWAGPARTFGSGTAALRSYRLYRWLIRQEYQPVEVRGASFLVRKDRYLELKGVANGPDTIPGLVEAFPDPDLAFIPQAWGGSYPQLARRFQQLPLPAADLTVTAGQLPVPEAGMRFPSSLVSYRFREPVDGGRWDFLSLTVTASRPSEAPLKVRISWAAPGEQPDGLHSVSFMAGSGSPLLVPLGSRPSWLLAPRVAMLTVEAADLGGGGAVAVGPLTLLSLKQ